MSHCGAVVKHFLARLLDEHFSLTLFFVLAFFFILTADPDGHALGSIYILSLSPEFYFGKEISKVLDLHPGQAYDPIKTISCQDKSLL